MQVDGDDYHEKLGYEGKASANTYVYEEISEEKDSNLMPLRTRTSQKRNVYNRHLGLVQQSM